MLRAAYRSHPARNEAALKPFDNYLTRIGYFTTRRNEIAHGRVVTSWLNGIKRGSFLCPAKYNSRKQRSLAESLEALNTKSGEEYREYWHENVLGSYAYSSKEIRYYQKQFRALANEALEFLIAICEWQAERDKHNVASNGGGG